jgi:hypothetical protein
VSAPYPTTREALMMDDNPRDLPIVHVTGVADEPWHRCAPRILAECRACGDQFNICDATAADVDAILARAWTCSQCRQARP